MVYLEPVSRGFIELEEVLEAWYLCRKNKRNTANALAFEVDCEAQVYDLWRGINDGSCQPAGAARRRY